MTAVLVVLTGPAPAASPAIRLSPNPVARGGFLTVEADAPGCPRGDQVTLISGAFSHRHDFAGKPAIFAKAWSKGRYATTTRIPKARKPGRYAVTARCGGGNLGVTARLTVT
jgi:hypothetical protein